MPKIRIRTRSETLISLYNQLHWESINKQIRLQYLRDNVPPDQTIAQEQKQDKLSGRVVQRQVSCAEVMEKLKMNIFDQELHMETAMKLYKEAKKQEAKHKDKKPLELAQQENKEMVAREKRRIKKAKAAELAEPETPSQPNGSNTPLNSK